MVEIKIQDKSYEIPTEWKDITLRYWCGLYSIINKYNKREDEGNVIEEEHSEVELLKMKYQANIKISYRYLILFTYIPITFTKQH